MTAISPLPVGATGSHAIGSPFPVPMGSHVTPVSPLPLGATGSHANYNLYPAVQAGSKSRDPGQSTSGAPSVVVGEQHAAQRVAATESDVVATQDRRQRQRGRLSFFFFCNSVFRDRDDHSRP